MITDLGPISTDVIEETQTIVKANRDNWTHISEHWPNSFNSPLYFYGSPVYACGPRHWEYYTEHRERSATVLKNLRLLSITMRLLADHYQLPVEQLPDTSLPGFHIFNGKSKQFTGDYHVDSDYMNRFPKCGYSFTDFYSFTIPLELPSNGGGLDYRRGLPVYHYPYTVGHAYIWKSNIFHRIADVNMMDDEYRMTYQGHFILQPDKLLYYW
jgi:hypothetical protein